MNENTPQLNREGGKAKERDMDPRHTTFLANYLNPKSKTFGNALQSALKAGFSESYSKVITARMPPWLDREVRKRQMVAQAEKNLVEFLEMPTQRRKINIIRKEDGEAATDGVEEYLETDPSLVRIKQDTTKFALERLNKEDYSARMENTGPGGGPIQTTLTPLDKSKLDALLTGEAPKFPEDEDLPINLQNDAQDVQKQDTGGSGITPGIQSTTVPERQEPIDNVAEIPTETPITEQSHDATPEVRPENDKNANPDATPSQIQPHEGDVRRGQI